MDNSINIHDFFSFVVVLSQVLSCILFSFYFILLLFSLRFFLFVSLCMVFIFYNCVFWFQTSFDFSLTLCGFTLISYYFSQHFFDLDPLYTFFSLMHYWAPIVHFLDYSLVSLMGYGFAIGLHLIIIMMIIDVVKKNFYRNIPSALRMFMFGDLSASIAYIPSNQRIACTHLSSHVTLGPTIPVLSLFHYTDDKSNIGVARKNS